jgi:hypothetical protein
MYERIPLIAINPLIPSVVRSDKKNHVKNPKIGMIAGYRNKDGTFLCIENIRKIKPKRRGHT